MLKTMKIVIKKALIISLTFMIVLGGSQFYNVKASVDVGSNPTPKIDIAVNVPSDYPGTFLDYKQELTQKLIDQGLKESDFRITNTAVSIDTSSMDGWIVYDHYHNESIYNNLVPADQRSLQPKRIANAASMGGTPGANILDYINKTTNKFTNTSCIQFNRHIGIYQSDSGASNMAFAGYGNPAYSDYMIYPAPSSNTRTFSFNIDASVINTHTLTGFGFLMNSGIINGKVYGYLLYFNASSAASGSGAVTIKKLNGVPADSLTTAFTGSGDVAGSGTSFSLGAQKKVRLTVELKRDSLTVQQQAYDASGKLSDVQTVLRDFAIPQFASETLNGLGPWVGYSSHGCSAFSAIVYTDLEMTYEASAFDALKYVQYYQGAEYKYFVNLAGTNNNPGIPNDGSNDYLDGINRMNNSEIFYVSNVQDGKVVTDSTYEKNEDGSLKLDELGNPVLAKDKDGNIIHQGLGSSNGCIATSDDYVSQMADFIAKNYFEENHFKQAQISSELPLASFYVKNVEDDQQLMTLHLRHLQLTDSTVDVNIHDKSKIGTASGADGKLTGYRYIVYNPNGSKDIDTGWVDGLDKIPNYTFTKNSTSGTYVFELTVRDDKGNESKTFQTYLTAYLDDKVPYIEGKNTEKNKATITLTDTGEGIDEDGITFIEDGRGSGVAAYWVTNDINAKPGETDWTVLDNVVHSYQFDYDITSTEPLVVWVKDECGNIGNQAVFQPTHVSVQDKDGNPIDDYYVIGDKPIIVLPDDDVVPPSEEEDEYHSGWVTPEGGDVTPGTTPDPDENHEIIIRPNYSKDQAALIYVANGGQIGGKDQSSYLVTAGSSILKKIGDHNVTPTREGYTFTGWKLLNSHSATDAANSTYINNAANVNEIKEQVAEASKNGGSNLLEGDHYYLIAQWEVSKYTLRLDANGGSLGNVRSIANVSYGQNLTAADISVDAGTQTIPDTGRGLPTKPGYIFQGWSESKDNNVSKIFKFANGITGTAVAAPTMPASDKTVYAVWKADTNKFVVQFNSNGGNKITDHAYLISTASKYNAFSEPQRSGYTFDGWYYEADLNGKTHTDENGIQVFNENATKPTAYVGGESIRVNSAHTFVAMWTPNTDTKYSVEYFVNSGKKDANNHYIYTKANGYTKNYTSKTESTVQVDPKDMTPEITVNGVKYWYNVDNSNNVLKGQVTGNPTLSLKLYYDRYFNVNATKKGEGRVTGATNVKEGLKPTVSWKPADGYHVAKVVIDGVIRDDLVKQTTFTYPDEFHENHTLYVEFEKDAEQTIAPPAEKSYEIRTTVLGCNDSSKYEITPTQRVKEGTDTTVTWSISDPNSRVVKVTVDGVDYDVTKTDVTFKGVLADHDVVVTIDTLPTVGGGQTEGNYTITVNRYGGDGNEIISPSAIVEPGDTHKVSWDVHASEYQIYKVLVDGVEKELTTAQKTKVGSQNFSNIKGNHVVDIYLTKVDDQGEPKVPIYSGEDYIQVTTQIVGGPGTITGGAVVEVNSNYDVNWDIIKSDDPDDPDYVYYEVEKVTVNGKTVSDVENEEVNLKNLDKDTDVVVHVKPVMHNVTIMKYGNGTVSESKTLYHLQNYKNITQAPADGWVTAMIIVDGKEVYKNDALDTPDQSSSVMSRMAKAARVSDATIDDILAIEKDHVIKVYFTQQNDDGTIEQLPDLSTLHNVNVIIQGGIGEVISGPAIINDGDTSTVSWSFDENKYELASVTVNGVQQTVEGKGFDLTNITEDKNVVVTLKEKALPDNNKVIPGNLHDKNHLVTAILSGVNGIISGSGEVVDGGNKEITWTSDDSEAEVVYIFINGELQEIVGKGNSLTLKNITEDQTVVIVMSKPNTPPVNVDKDGDGKPDINIDKDGDGNPDVDVDTDKDGKPDINIDKDKDGEPDINIDTDKDGKPDINIDTDKDGKPDINIDTDKDGKPDINVDTDKDGKPDINIDTDKDGKPDINIDTDDDDIPDVNIDTDKDGKPDINIDTDKDGKPDINIDTDKDGKPDINIDTDGDGKPDINIDTDGDGKPDINIDRDGDGKPDINIDTDNDGKPDKNLENNVNVDKEKEKLKTEVEPDKIQKNSQTKTGDRTNIEMFFGLLVGSMMLGYMLLKRKKHEEE